MKTPTTTHHMKTQHSSHLHYVPLYSINNPHQSNYFTTLYLNPLNQTQSYSQSERSLHRGLALYDQSNEMFFTSSSDSTLLLLNQRNRRLISSLRDENQGLLFGLCGLSMFVLTRGLVIYFL